MLLKQTITIFSLSYLAVAVAIASFVAYKKYKYEKILPYGLVIIGLYPLIIYRFIMKLPWSFALAGTLIAVALFFLYFKLLIKIRSKNMPSKDMPSKKEKKEIVQGQRAKKSRKR